ncbi:MAG: hypothetical protein V3T17_13165 [Pseudomonadales bacterium]
MRKITKKSQSSPRENMLRVRFSKAEFQQLEALAQEAGCSKSALVRDHLGKLKIHNRQDQKAQTAMLNRLNANLNMIAKWVNTYKKSADTVEVITHLCAIERNIQESIL